MHMLMYAQTLRYQIADGCDCLLMVRNKFLVGLLKLRVENVNMLTSHCLSAYYKL